MTLPNDVVAMVEALRTARWRDVAQFHRVDADVIAAARELSTQLADFLARFGAVRLLKTADYYPIEVFPDLEDRSWNDDPFACFGQREGFEAAFRDDGDNRRGEPAVFELIDGEATQVADDFDAWFTDTMRDKRHSMGDERWREVIDGPAPFSPEERAILDRRTRFRWRQIRQHGDAVELEIHNQSGEHLSWLTLGVDAKGLLRGRTHVDVANIAPGRTAMVRVVPYPDLPPGTQLTLFDLPAPTPEDRDSLKELTE